MRRSLPRVITINFNHPPTHRHYLRELILKFQTLNGDPSGQKTLKFRMNEVKPDDISQNLTHLFILMFPVTFRSM